MTWRYEVAKKDTGEICDEFIYGVVEKYELKDGEYHTDFVTPLSDSPEGMIFVLTMMINDIKYQLENNTQTTEIK